MKNFTLFFALLLLPLGLLATDCIPNCECETDWTLEVRGAYYRPFSKGFTKIYSRNLIDYQVEAAKRIHPFCEIWAGIHWASKHGHSQKMFDYCDQSYTNHSRVSILPVSLGAKFIYPIMPCVDIYVGAGVCYSFLRIKNICQEDYSYSSSYQQDYYGSYDEHRHSTFKKAIYKDGLGAIFKLGIQIAMGDSTFLDVFADYYDQRFDFSHHKGKFSRSLFKHHLDCSGFKLGAGLGVYF